tara:strand:+ start:607 stop:807 length:201 start_codon:yes stop_codon:yes gene_type:complete
VNIFNISLSVAAIETAVGLFLITSEAKDGPDNIAILLFKVKSLIIWEGNKPDSDSIPLQAKIIGPS